MNFYDYEIKTNKSQTFVDLTKYMKDVINKSGIYNGRMTLFCPHTTAGLTINENADPDVIRDMLVALEKVFPIHGDYKHFEGNSHAHLKASFMGSDQTVLIEKGQLLLGRWQSVYFCEFDGPRTRQLKIYIEGEGYESH